MPKITVVDRKDISHELYIDLGEPLMYSLRDNGFVEALCGGQCACATCHVYMEDPSPPNMPDLSEIESGLLESSLESADKSRLSCQLIVSEDFDGIVVVIPEEG